jgi:NMD protein affecting ribosome stability and mRNA decay
VARSKSDISNHAIRIFLQDVGKFYDEERGLTKFIPNKKQKEELLSFFKNECCFCGKLLKVETLCQDHLIALNKKSLGLHAWGNVVPCCYDCNKVKHHKDWLEFLKASNTPENFDKRKNRINEFITNYKYNPRLNLQEIAANLYQDVGEVAATLIKLRYHQAEEIIKQVLKK